MENNYYGIVLVTASSKDEASSIARVIIEESLGACVNFMPINSVYRWEGKVCQEEEWQLIIKTDLQFFERLESKIRELHSYDVPEIIAIPITKGSQPYLNWITENVIKSSTI
ncbi:divalent-cation tolerance protein CutA [Geminocystis sp. CENA526]